MPVLAISNTVYTRPVAKVMISIPDALLERIDAHAGETGETRSGFIQRLAEHEIGGSDQRRREEFERLLGLLDIELGGVSAAQAIREDRESH
jgi:hypothetical protein